jgi:hypothetical protein
VADRCASPDGATSWADQSQRSARHEQISSA